MRLSQLKQTGLISSNIWQQKVSPIYLAIVFCCLSQAGCTANKLAGLPQVESIDLLEESLGGSRLTSCIPLTSSIPVGGEVTRAHVVWEGSRASLIYEANFTDGSKTLWQPLSSAFEPSENPVILGPEKGSQVQDFALKRDPRGNTWTHYRVRDRKDESMKGILEFSTQAGKITRITIPVAKTEVPQRIWLLPLSLRPDAKSSEVGDFAHVVVRTTTVHDEMPVVRYQWFSFDPARKSLVRHQSYLDPNSDLNSVTFFHVPGYADPVAAGIKTGGNTALGKQFKTTQSWSNIIAFRMFAPARETLVINKIRANLNSLAVAPSTDVPGEVFFAWIREPSGNQIRPIVEWAAARPSFTQQAIRSLPLTHPLESLAVEHSPFGLEFIEYPFVRAGAKSLTLTWFASVDQDVGLVARRVIPPGKTRINPAPKGQITRLPQTLAFFSRFRLGTPQGLSVPGWGSGHPLILVFAEQQGNPQTSVRTQIRFCTLASKAFDGL